MEVHLATAADCGLLARTSQRAFDADVAVGAPGVGGPPGYDSERWHQRARRWGDVYVLRDEDEPVGGAIVIRTSPTEVNLGRIWLVPECQGRGLGWQAMAAVESLYPQVTRWTLETPIWNLRNRHFYLRCGYRVTEEVADEVRFEKIVEPR